MPEPSIEIVLDRTNQLGEGPCWHGGEQALYWVDALAPAVHRLDAAGELSTWTMPEIIGSFVFRRAGGLVGALKSGFAAIDLADGAVSTIVDPEPDRPTNILNDGKCDRRGRYWCGSRNGELINPTGALHRLDPDLSVRRMDQGFIVSNGIAFSPDDRTLYLADSRAETVFAYDLDIDDGVISNRRVFFSTRDIAGRCDGATVDAEGFYWCALIHGGQVARVDPKGRFDRLIDLPVKHPTMCTFGGRKLDILYVTSAAAMVPETERTATPHAGALFAIHDLGVRGLPEPHFGG
ncbi:SMP-30/gluconolactonase/LRE family protein [Phreatobacter stygius]|uniref:SMP-30/gluconolactonase/LRE family protein n=1 Tax=Phreatobacter stygius TaxID=1940610 RepID=A0A4D7BCC0_9HYPH|nr:SMP-30/gluconolactonase/LRE family protein [Phreatobacter stygius]QCI67026.1 SMP-30/gluconolactonase/LRE family protein [Phreatobacter stygius]